MPKTITIPGHNTFDEDELVLIPKREYKTLLDFKMNRIPEINLTAKQRQAFLKSDHELKMGEYFTLTGLKKYVGSSRAKARRQIERF